MLNELKLIVADRDFFAKALLGIAAFVLLLCAFDDSKAAVPTSSPAELSAHAARMEIKYGLPDRLLRAVCEQESHWRNGLRGKAGEIGVCQVQVDTVRMICPDCGTNVRRQFFLAGSAGPLVARIQAELLTQGYYLGKTDGVFGEGTRGAVVAFQQRAGILADGIVGPQTWSKLFAEPYPGVSIETELWDAHKNIEWAAKYLAWLQVRVSSDPAILMAAYNGGSANPTVVYMVSVSLKRQAIEEARLREVTAMRERGMNAYRWNKIAEKMPPKGVPILVSDGRIVTAAELDRGGWWLPVGVGGYECEWEFNTNNISHWMPMPGLPE